MRPGQPFGRDDSHKLGFDLVGREGIRNPQTMRDTKHMGIDGNGGLNIQFVKHDRSALAPHAWQGLQRFAVQRDFATKIRQ